MKYKFPLISHIDQVLPVIKDRDDFIVAQKDGYKVINYVYQTNETFPAVVTQEDAIIRECRGLVFNDRGEIISRAFHKFFNYGEKPEEQANQDYIAPQIVLHKLDGSMIRPIYLDKHFRLATKMGITDIAMQAEYFIADKSEYTAFIEDCRTMSWTPIFEWCSRKNQVIIDHAEDKLVLLAVRNLYSGEYLEHIALCNIAHAFNIPLVEEALHFDGDIEKIAEKTKTEEGNEGYVLVFKDGHRLKVKSEWYVTLHKSKEAVSKEKNLVKLILLEQIDDLKPLLVEQDLKDVEDFEIKLWQAVRESAELMTDLFEDILFVYTPESRKDFALAVLKMESKYRPFMFKLYENHKAFDLVKEALLKATGSNTKMEDAKWLMGNVEYKGKEL